MRTFLRYSVLPAQLLGPLLVLLLWQQPVQALQQGQLFDLIDARLELMDEVAAYKWQHGLAIEDKVREQIVLDKAAEDALNANLDPISSRLFFEAQIDAAKEIQRYWFSQYESAQVKPEARDLNQEVRPELLRLGQEILSAMSANPTSTSPTFVNLVLNESSSVEFIEHVNVVGLSSTTRDALFSSLLAVTHFPNALTRILQTGKLRVGTTGDYAPFSWKTGDQWQGIDIDMARDLAASLNVELQLVPTTWPTLIADLNRGVYDIGMSGISINTERALHGYYTLPYHTGGKTPIARCEDQNQYSSLASIDQPSVRVIVNPGGTNNRFVSDSIKRANIIIFPDNRTVFDEIAEGRADVMITDAIEVKLVSQNNDVLCPTMPGQTFTQSQKAYLMQPDIRLKEYVNTWLSMRITDGSYQKIFDAAFSH